MNPATDRTSPAAAAHGRTTVPGRPGFTLNELLIVIAIAVLVVALAVPAFNVITNSRSIDSAENQAAAYLGIARAEAISLQEPRGVIFFEDLASGRITLAPVYYPPNRTNVADIDLFAGRDEVILPKGVGWQAVPEGSAANQQDFPWTPWGVVMFDGTGSLMIDNFRIPAEATDPKNKLRDRVGVNGGGGLKNRLGNPLNAPIESTPAAPIRSTIGFLLFDRLAFDELPTTVRSDWLRDNGTPFLVNRYNGTVLRSQ